MFLKKTAVNLNKKKKKTFKNKTINFNNLKNCFRKYIKKILTKKSNNLTTWCFLMMVKNLRDDRGPLYKQLFCFSHLKEIGVKNHPY